ncbi:atp18 subunit J of the mitochondrial F1F0 ATP synthase [Hanseniaspora vineae]
MALRTYSFPILKSYWPFFVTGVVTYWGVGKAADLSANTAEFINDPRNPRFQNGGKFIELEK